MKTTSAMSEDDQARRLSADSFGCSTEQNQIHPNGPPGIGRNFEFQESDLLESICFIIDFFTRIMIRKIEILFQLSRTKSRGRPLISHFPHGCLSLLLWPLSSQMNWIIFDHVSQLGPIPVFTFKPGSPS